MHCTSMESRSIARRILVWALGGSLGLHFVFALCVHRIPVVDAKEREPGHATIVHIHVVVTPSPTPQPVVTPRPAQQPHPTQPHVAPHPPATHVIADAGPTQAPGPVSTGGPPQDGTPDTNGTASPAPAVPTPTPHPACSNPNVPAKAVDPISPPVPEEAAGASGSAQVEVTLNPSGGVERASVFRSTGNLVLDRAALRAARISVYTAEVRDCVPVTGTYLFTVDFQS